MERGWRNSLLIWAIWLVAFVLGASVLPSWLLTPLIGYMFVGEMICHNLQVHAPIDPNRFDVPGTLRSLYWLLWWPYYLRRRR